MESFTLLLVGYGKMGSALLEGWLAQGMDPQHVGVVEPHPELRRQARKHNGIAVHADVETFLDTFQPQVVVMAVKPQAMASVLPIYKRFAVPDTVFLSIAAGRTLAGFEEILGPKTAVVRSMPNTPALVGRGASVACANANVTQEERRICHDLLSAVGVVAWVEDESLMDAVTAVSGSGPAYVFYLAECLARAGMDAGLPRELAVQLARDTVTGAGELLSRSEETCDTLRQNVTSPGGTTEAALDVLMSKSGLRAVITEAVAAATKRSKELAE